MYLEQLYVYMPFVFTNIHELQDNINFYLCIWGLVSKQCLKNISIESLVSM
jgi:hypothetical protein